MTSTPLWQDAKADLTTGPAVPDSTVEGSDSGRNLLRSLLVEVGVVSAWFGLVGMVGALIWVKATPLPGFTRIAETGTMDEAQLAKQFSTSGWFLVIAVVGGLLSGLVLVLVRRSAPPLMMVGLIALGGALATVVMLRCGLVWGPGDPNVALADAQIGEVIPVQLKPDVNGIYFAWSVAALVGAAIALGFLGSRETADEPADQNVPTF